MAKLTGIEIGRSIAKEFGHDVLNLMPTNLYGPYMIILILNIVMLFLD